MSIYDMSPEELSEYLSDVEADEAIFSLDDEDEECPPTLRDGLAPR